MFGGCPAGGTASWLPAFEVRRSRGTAGAHGADGPRSRGATVGPSTATCGPTKVATAWRTWSALPDFLKGGRGRGGLRGGGRSGEPTWHNEWKGNSPPQRSLPQRGLCTKESPGREVAKGQSHSPHRGEKSRGGCLIRLTGVRSREGAVSFASPGREVARRLTPRATCVTRAQSRHLVGLSVTRFVEC